jgi:hypothetical protein
MNLQITAVIDPGGRRPAGKFCGLGLAQSLGFNFLNGSIRQSESRRGAGVDGY